MELIYIAFPLGFLLGSWRVIRWMSRLNQEI